MWKIWITAFTVKVTANVQVVSECLCGYLLNHKTFCHQTFFFGGGCRFMSLKVKVAARAHIKMWLFLLYPMNRWFFGNQTWTISQSVLWGEKIDCCVQGQGHSKGSKCQCLSRWYLLSCVTFRTFCNVMRYHELECHVKRLVCDLELQGLNKDS